MAKKTIFLFAPLDNIYTDRGEEIQRAVDEAVEGDIIVLSPGTYCLSIPITLSGGVKILSGLTEKP